MKHNKAITLGLLPICLAVIAVSLYVLGQETAQPDSTTSHNTTQPLSDNNTQSADSEVSADQLRAGWQNHQATWEESNPEFPGAERITYAVTSGQLVDGSDPADAFLWEMVKQLAPNTETLDSISTFEVYLDDEDGSLASVESINDDNSSWIFSINYIAVTDFEELVGTIIHEHSHILSLQDSQTITQDEEPAIRSTCSQYLVDEGCLEQSSLLNAFYDRFWRNSGLYLDRDRTEDETVEISEQYPDTFVTDYAATNPVEDFAETLQYFVMQGRPADETPRTERINFFYDDQSMRDYRIQAREVISSW